MELTAAGEVNNCLPAMCMHAVSGGWIEVGQRMWTAQAAAVCAVSCWLLSVCARGCALRPFVLVCCVAAVLLGRRSLLFVSVL